MIKEVKKLELQARLKPNGCLILPNERSVIMDELSEKMYALFYEKQSVSSDKMMHISKVEQKLLVSLP